MKTNYYWANKDKSLVLIDELEKITIRSSENVDLTSDAKDFTNSLNGRYIYGHCIYLFTKSIVILLFKYNSLLQDPVLTWLKNIFIWEHFRF